jgi:TPR repeat protein
VTTSERYRDEIARLKKRVRAGDDCQMDNIAATYRLLGNRRRAFEWWRRAAIRRVKVDWQTRTVTDGSSLLEFGYCYQYGMGVRRDVRAACKAYLAAVRSKWIDECSREEALYHLAVAYLDFDKGVRGRRRAAELLREAAADSDYPQAADLLGRLESGEGLLVCRCRRYLMRRLRVQARCELHGRAGRRHK